MSFRPTLPRISHLGCGVAQQEAHVGMSFRPTLPRIIDVPVYRVCLGERNLVSTQSQQFFQKCYFLFPRPHLAVQPGVAQRSQQPAKERPRLQAHLF